MKINEILFPFSFSQGGKHKDFPSYFMVKICLKYTYLTSVAEKELQIGINPLTTNGFSAIPSKKLDLPE